MDSTLIQLDDRHLIRVGILAGKSRQEDLAKAWVVKPRILPKKGLTGQWFHQAIEPDPLKASLLYGDGWNTVSRDTTAVDRLEAQATFIAVYCR